MKFVVIAYFVGMIIGAAVLWAVMPWIPVRKYHPSELAVDPKSPLKVNRGA